MSRSSFSDRARPWAPWAVLVLAAVLVALVAGRPRSEGPPLDPTSAGRLGTKAVVDVLRDLGVPVSVQVQAPSPADTTALLLSDDLDDPTRDALLSWVEAGGALVVTDVFSPLDPARPRVDRPDLLDPTDDQVEGACDLPALSRVERVVAPSAVYQAPPSGAATCFSRGDGAWLVSVERGRGTIVAIGGASAFVNANLDEGDNAVLAVDLLAPTPSDRVVVLRPSPAGGGDASLWSLVAPRVKLALAQLAIAFVVVALWRARRLGRPVLEPQPVQIEASELVVAVGELMQRARAREQAASVLRDDLRRALAEQSGLAPGTPADVVAEAVASRRPDVSSDEVLAVLLGRPPAGEEALVDLARQVEALRARAAGRGDRVGSWDTDAIDEGGTLAAAGQEVDHA